MFEGMLEEQVTRRGSRPCGHLRGTLDGSAATNRWGRKLQKFLRWIARSFHYDARKIARGQPADLTKFLEIPEVKLNFDFGANTGRSALTDDTKSNFRRSEVSDPATKTLIVEGWRFLAHSYAIVNQWQLLALSRRTDVSVKVRDVPLYGRRWQVQHGLFEPLAGQALRTLATAEPNESADVTLRVFFPFDFSPSPSRLTAVFATSESQVIRQDQLSNFAAYAELRRAPPPANVKVVTPSHWSAEGFYKAGFAIEQVLIVPHGVDVETFHPMPEVRKHIRSRISVADSEFVFLSIGAMTGNKGIDLLLQAFSEISRKFPQARLVLKGMDSLYSSKALLQKTLQGLSGHDQQRVIDRVTYFGNSFSNTQMAQFYQVADAYVSPYRAEGFNMPVLEAAACGIPILCTRGGATEDFVSDDFARKIESKKSSVRIAGQDASRLEPNIDHLIALMSSAIEDDTWRQQAAKAGPFRVRANYTWDRIVDTLVRKLFD